VSSLMRCSGGGPSRLPSARLVAAVAGSFGGHLWTLVVIMKRHDTRKKKIAIGVVICVVLVAVGIALSAAFYVPWGSGWPHVPPGKLFVTTRPNVADIAGVYELTHQTITTEGLAVLKGQPCQLALRPDGSFTVTNYPRWSPESDSSPPVAEFVSATGHWRCDTINIMYDGHLCWGVLFSDSKGGIDALALRSKGAPYNLMLTYGGEYDEGRVMIFGRKK